MTSKVRTAINWRGIIMTGLAYGGGLTAGNIFSQIIFSMLSPEPYGYFSEGVRLIIGIGLVMIVTGIGAALGGFLGGWTLPVIGEPKGKYGYAWRSAFSTGVVYGAFLLLAVFGLSTLTMRDAAFMPVGPFIKAYLLVGMIMGALVGLLLGLMTVGWRRTGSLIIATVVGFGLGGAVMGAGLWAYLSSTPPGGLYKGDHIYLLVGLLALGLLGGLAIGFAFDRLARKESGYDPRPMRPWVRYGLYALAGLFAFWLLLSQLRPFLDFAGEYLTPRSALQTERIAADSVGVHWRESTHFLDESAEETAVTVGAVTALDLSAGEPGDTVLVWAEATGSGADIFLQIGQGVGTGDVVGPPPVNVSNSPADSQAPSVAVDATSAAHVAWLEGDDQVAQYSLCTADECTEPLPLTDAAVTCHSGSGSADTWLTDIAAGPDGTVMVVWSGSEGSLGYRQLPDGGQGCIPLPEGVAAGGFSLAGHPSTGFSLVFDNNQNNIWMTKYASDDWDSAAIEVGAGVRPELLVSENGSEFVVWCAEGGGVAFWSQGQTEVLSQLSCQGNPAVAMDWYGQIHAVWQSDQVEDVLGALRPADVLYETIGDGESWSEPLIVARLEGPADYKIANDPAGNLFLAWSGSDPAIHYALQQPYACDPDLLSGAGADLYAVASLGGYRPEDDVIPFCQNQYQKILFTPAVDPAFSDAEPTLNGGFDDYAELLQSAEFEALFTTMAYSKAVNKDSPGAVLARGVVDLYKKVKANPDDYPRGMTVRLLLGNSPTLNFELLEVDGGLWYILKDLKEAGLEKMIDPELGWRVEVGNFAGRLPYSHAKMLIIDGKTVVASGFNHEYKPLSKDHPSGLGKGDTDTGLVMTGPVAQHSRLVYDQLWTGAIQRYCPDLDASEAVLRLTCSDSRGLSDHPPEVMRYALTDGDAIAFSMFRNQVYDEADQQLLAAYRAAEESIDLAQAVYSMPLICILNHFFEVCDFSQALPYMEALMDAVENGAEVRIVLTPYPTQNIESVVAMAIFNQAAVERGVAQRVEIRILDGLLHSKSALIDGEFLIIGSQNLQWIAYGKDYGLSEYSLGVEDPNAAEQYQRFFDYLWARSPSRVETVN